jgi:thiosulfate/3-mercaptopyruvate sulfurtransferase
MKSSIVQTRYKTTGMLLHLCFTLMVVSIHAQSPVSGDGIKGNLVTVSWLEKNLGSANLVLLDASPTPIYAAKHIPGAISYDIFTYGVRELPVADLENRFQSWGISLGKRIVIYDQGATILATRLFFSLNYYGFPAENLLILDGGLSKWQESGLPVTGESAPAPVKGTFAINRLNKDVRVDLPEFLTASGDPGHNVLVEALDPNWHYGAYNYFGRPGHIPNAIMLPASDFYNPDNTFKSPEELRKIMTYLGIDPEKNVLSHCGGGIAASVPFFALKYILGYKNVRLFPGSLMEWASDERELPLWTYEAPFMMRNADWLQSWGGKMMRMYGMTHVSFLDVRPAAIFKAGYMQYALNIPAIVFKNNVTNPARLADALVLAGIDTAYETVIISGGGLTKEAALAFVLLEKLGCKKISLFAEPADKWAQLGFTVIKDTVAGNADEGSPGTSKPALVRVNLQKGIIVGDPGKAQGVYPRVFIASGINIPAHPEEDQVIHVPFSDLLNPDGTPKEAKDIWNILTKAGIPRYAELICFADDPGEAEANYFILKLMGFPDIKVLANGHL